MIRKSSLKRSSPPKRVNRKRKAKSWGRAYGSVERVAFVASLPCIVEDTFLPCAGKIENAHIETAGMGLKAGADRDPQEMAEAPVLLLICADCFVGDHK